MRRRGEVGETLVELLVAVSILGLSVVTIVAALGTGILTSDVAAKQGQVQAALRTAAEEVKAAAWSDCAGVTTYAVSSPTDVEVRITQVMHASSGPTVTFSATCPTPPSAVQRVSLTGRALDDRVVQTLDVVKRRTP